MRTSNGEPGFSRACFLLLVANILDGVFTFTYLQMHLVKEANPVMRWLYDASPVAFMLFKVSCVQLGMLILWLYRWRRAAVVGIWVTAALYAMVVAYHFTIAASLRA
jgi:hypothetical protein